MRPFRFSSLPLTVGKRIFEHEHISLAHFNLSTKQFEYRSRSQNSGAIRTIRTKSLTDAKYLKQEMDCPIYFKLQEQDYLYAALPSDVIEITDEIYNSSEPLSLSPTLYHITTEAAIKYYEQNGFIYRNHLSALAPNIEPIYFQRAYPTSDRYVLEIDLTNPSLYMKDDITTQYRFFKHKDKDDIFTYEDIDPLLISINIK